MSKKTALSFFLSFLVFAGIISFFLFQAEEQTNASFSSANITTTLHDVTEEKLPFATAIIKQGTKISWEEAMNDVQSGFWYYEVKKNGKSIFRTRDSSENSFLDTEFSTGKYEVITISR